MEPKYSIDEIKQEILKPTNNKQLEKENRKILIRENRKNSLLQEINTLEKEKINLELEASNLMEQYKHTSITKEQKILKRKLEEKLVYINQNKENLKTAQSNLIPFIRKEKELTKYEKEEKETAKGLKIFATIITTVFYFLIASVDKSFIIGGLIFFPILWFVLYYFLVLFYLLIQVISDDLSRK